MFRRASLRATRRVFLVIALVSCFATGCAWPWSRANGPLPPPPLGAGEYPSPESGNARISLSDDTAPPARAQVSSEEQVSSRRLPSLDREAATPADPAATSSRRTAQLADTDPSPESSRRRTIADTIPQAMPAAPPAPPREFVASAESIPLSPTVEATSPAATAALASAATPIASPAQSSPASQSATPQTPTAKAPTPAVRSETATATQPTEADIVTLVNRLRALNGADPAIVAQLEDSLRRADPSQLPLLVMQFEAMLDMQEGTSTPAVAAAPAPAALPTPAIPAALPTPAATPLASAETFDANEYIRQTLAQVQSPNYDSSLAMPAPLPPTGSENPATASLSLIGSPPFTPPSHDTAAQAAEILQRVSALEAGLPSLGTPPEPTAMSPAMLTPQVAATPAVVPAEEPVEFTSLPLAAPLNPADPAAPFQEVGPRNWQESLAEAIAVLEATQSQDTDDAALRRQQEGLLRLLYLAHDRHAQALEPIDSWPAEDQAFWTHLMQAMHTYLDANGTPIAENRAQLTLRDLHRAAGYLASASRLDVRNLAFCQRVDSYGRYTPFREYDFAPNQEVLLYVEVENFQADETSEGWVTTLLGRYQIFDETGRRIADFEFPAEEEVCRNRRRDFFIPYHLYLPTRIMPGRYTLQLTMEDTRGQQFGQSSIDFRIVQ